MSGNHLLRYTTLLILAPVIAGCAVNDSHIARAAPQRLIGLSEVDLQACLGSPDQHTSFGTTDIITYYANSDSSMNYSVPIIGGLSFSNGGYCHATFRIDNGTVTQVIYSGEKNATLAPDAYCAPIVRSCLERLSKTNQPA
jgi:hypothetical protein